jgi:tetratricopeptide (TPR) repeat protein
MLSMARNARMKAALRVSQLSLVVVVVLLGGCTVQMAQSWHLSGYDRDIKNGTEAIEAARDDAHRAAGYAQRGRAYSEKARYSRAFKLIPADEYGRLFSLAVKDGDQAVALDPASTDAYFSRGMIYYERAALEESKDAKAWFDPAVADFKKAFEKDSKNDTAVDMLGVAHEQSGALDEAIRDYTAEMALNPLGKRRLADAYCTRGTANQVAKKYDAAVADYEKSIEMGATDDGCSCEPYGQLIALYSNEGGQPDKALEAVRRAQKAKKWVDPELLVRLKKIANQ